MTFAQIIVMILMFLVASFLVLLILVQRGRGGGLAGALGGAGGQSAFGTKSGDMFTKITAGSAIVWILLCSLSVRLFDASNVDFNDPTLGANKQTTATDTAGTGDNTTSNGDTETSDTETSVPASGTTAELPADGAVPAGETDATP